MSSNQYDVAPSDLDQVVKDNFKAVAEPLLLGCCINRFKTVAKPTRQVGGVSTLMAPMSQNYARRLPNTISIMLLSQTCTFVVDTGV